LPTLLSSSRGGQQRMKGLTLNLSASLMLLLAFGASSHEAALAIQTPPFCRPMSAEDVPKAVRGPVAKGIALGLNAEVRAPGQTLYARLLNEGKGRVHYPPMFRIERYVNSQWTVDPSSPKGPWHANLDLLAPGRAGKCSEFEVPQGQADGRYRIVKSVLIGHGHSRSRKRSKRVAEFFVSSDRP
ncbi:MAG TPA: immunoglobulin-like domain-containing protein, partial [Solirubrobacterales bacterium]